MKMNRRRTNAWEGLQLGFQSHGSPSEFQTLDLFKDVFELLLPLGAWKKQMQILSGVKHLFKLFLQTSFIGDDQHSVKDNQITKGQRGP